MTRIDNRLSIKMNNAVLYERTFNGDPLLNEIVDIIDELQPWPFENNIEFVGYNGPFANPDFTMRNPWHFKFTITKDDLIVVDVEQSGQNDQAMSNDVPPRPIPGQYVPVRNFELVFQNSHTIVKERTAG